MHSYRRDQSMSRRENDNKYSNLGREQKDYGSRNLNRSSFSDNRMRDDFRNRDRDYNVESDNRIKTSFNEFGNERRNQNYPRSDDQRRDSYNDNSNRAHKKNVQSNIRMGENSDGLEHNFRRDYHMRDSFNDFRDQDREKNVDSSFRMRENSNDNRDRALERKSGRDNQLRDSFRNQGRDHGNQGRERNFGSDYQMRHSFKDFRDQDREQNFDSGFRIRKNSNENRDRALERKSGSDFHLRDSFRDQDRDHSKQGRERNYGSDYEMRESFSDQSRKKNVESGFCMRENFNDFIDQGPDDGNQDRKGNFGIDYQMRESFNDFSRQACDKNFLSDSRIKEAFIDFGTQRREVDFGNDDEMKAISDDYTNSGRNNNNDNRRRESSHDLDNPGRDYILGSGDRMRGSINDFDVYGRINDFESDNEMRKNSNDFRNQRLNTDLGSTDRMRKNFNNFQNQEHDNDFVSRRSGDRDNYFTRDRNSGGHTSIERSDLFQNTSRHFNRDSKRAEDADKKFRDHSQATKISSFKRYNDNDLSQSPPITRRDDSVNYPEGQEHPMNSYVNDHNQKNDNKFNRTIQRKLLKQRKLTKTQYRYLLKACPNDNDLSQSPPITRLDDSVNYPEGQEHPMNSYVNDHNQKNDNKFNRTIQRKQLKQRKLTKTQYRYSLKACPNSVVEKATENRKLSRRQRKRLEQKEWLANHPGARKPLTKKQRTLLERTLLIIGTQPNKSKDEDNDEDDDNVYDDDENTDGDNDVVESTSSNSKYKHLSLIIKDLGDKRGRIEKKRNLRIQKSILKRISKDKSGAPPPIFTYVGITNSYFRLICANENSCKWVYDNISHLEDLWNTANLLVYPDDQNKRITNRRSIAFEPISKEDLKVKLVDRNHCHGRITNSSKFKLQNAINNIFPNRHPSPYKFDITGQGVVTVDCNDLTSMQWLYDNLSGLNLWKFADLHLIQRRTALYYRKITFKLKKPNFLSTSLMIRRIRKFNPTLRTGLWIPYSGQPDGYTLSFAIDEESVRDIEALGSRIHIFEDTIDVQIGPRDNSLPKQSFIKDSLLGSGCNDSSGTNILNDNN